MAESFRHRSGRITLAVASRAFGNTPRGNRASPARWAYRNQIRHAILHFLTTHAGGRVVGIDYSDSHLVPTTSSKSCAKASMTVKNRSGVKGSVIDRMSQHYHGKFFVDSSSEERIAVLTILSHNDQMTDLPEVRFFRELKHWTIRGYYTSKIGIHDELEYKANRVLLE
jgi:hypothetical protein